MNLFSNLTGFWPLNPRALFFGEGGEPVEHTATGNPVTFRTSIKEPLRALAVAIEPTQSGSGTQSPDNVRPIVGVTGLTLTRNQTAIVTKSFGQTVYGGTLDVLAGTLTVTHAYIALDDPAKWIVSTHSNVVYEYSDAITPTRKKYTSSYTGLYCTYLPVTSTATRSAARWRSSSADLVGFRVVDGDSETITLERIQTDAAAGKIAICYELAEPTTVTLTPETVTALAGTNTIQSDATGEITVTYLARGGG